MSRSGRILVGVLVRIFAWLLAILVVTGSAARAQASFEASLDVPGAVADGTEGFDGFEGMEGTLPRAPEPVTVAAPPRPEPVSVAVPRAPAHGRMHAVLIFRPPRQGCRS